MSPHHASLSRNRHWATVLEQLRDSLVSALH